MRNIDIIMDYVEGKKEYGAVNHIGYTLNRIWNYSTLMCEIDRKENKAYLNIRKYSRTTTKIQNMIRDTLTKYGFEIVEVMGAAANYWNFGYMGAETWKKSDFAI